MCVCAPWTPRLTFGIWEELAGGAGGADETDPNKDTHQSPVIQLGTSNCVPSELKFIPYLIPFLTRTMSGLCSGSLTAVTHLCFQT